MDADVQYAFVQRFDTYCEHYASNYIRTTIVDFGMTIASTELVNGMLLAVRTRA